MKENSNILLDSDRQTVKTVTVRSSEASD